jgi:hypothetical protein
MRSKVARDFWKHHDNSEIRQSNRRLCDIRGFSRRPADMLNKSPKSLTVCFSRAEDHVVRCASLMSNVVNSFALDKSVA